MDYKVSPLLIFEVAFVLGCVVTTLFVKPKTIESVVELRDTTYIERVDTIVINKPKLISIKQIDTTYIEVEKKVYVPIPINKYHFSEYGKYDIWARGYNVDIDSVFVFPRVEDRIITNTIEKTVVVKKWDLYLGAGAYAFNGKIAPTIGATIKSPNKWLLNANVGIMDSKVFYGGTLSYKIGK